MWCVHWNLLHPQNLWAGRQGVPSAPELSVAWSQRGWSSTTWPFFAMYCCCIPHRYPAAPLREVGMALVVEWLIQPPLLPLDIWHTDVEDLSWNKHSVLCHSCDVCAWAPGLQSWEQVTMSQRLFNSYTYTGKLGRGGVVFKLILFIFSTSFPAENSASHDAAANSLKVILAPALQGVEGKGKGSAQR